MQSNLYVGLSAQVALQRRLETIANNVANASTAGFRAEEVKFETVLSRAGADPVAFATAGQDLPVAQVRRARAAPTTCSTWPWRAMPGSAIQTPAGTVYTRDGRMRMTDTGELQTLNGYPVLDAGGAPHPPRSQRRPAAHRPRRHDHPEQPAGRRHRPVQDRRRSAKLTRFENSGVMPDRPADAGRSTSPRPACSRATSSAPTSIRCWR